ncbi:MAG: STY4526/YPO1902 family pathogenicity island replication protein [Gammaproteobacteria bacterium]
MKSNIYEPMNRAVIQVIVCCYENGKLDELVKMGVSVEQAEYFASLEMRQLGALVGFRGSLIDFKLATQRLEYFLPHIEAESEKEEKLMQLIRYGATMTMLESLANVSRPEYQMYLKRIGKTHGTTGRPRQLTPDEEHCVNGLLTDILTAYDDPLDRYIAIGKQSGVSLGSVWLWYNDTDARRGTGSVK